jgi:peptide/nickel transport system substrate-binding protein
MTDAGTATPKKLMRRRVALRLVCLGSVGLAVSVACAPAPRASEPQSVPPTPAAATTNTATPPQQPKRGGTLRLGVPGDSGFTVDPHSLSPRGLALLYHVYDRLIVYDDRLQPQPQLAESWEFANGSTQLKLTLRKGVQFHTGREFSSDDVAFNVRRAADPKIGPQISTMAAWVKDVQTPDKYTAILTFDQPRPGVLDLFEYMGIVDRETVQAPDAQMKAVGTGPFKFDQWLPGVSLRLTRNPNYWQSGRPYLDEIAVTILRDEQAMAVQLEAGALDIAGLPALLDAARLQKDPAYQMVRTAGAGYNTLVFNTTVAPTNNKLVRQALNYAIDRKRIADTVLAGIAAPISLPWPEYSPAYEASKQQAFAFDLAKAQALLTQAGVANVELDFVYATPSLYDKVAEIYQSDLAKIGVKLNLKGLEGVIATDTITKLTYGGVGAVTSQFAHLQPGTLPVIARLWKSEVNQAGFKSERYSQLVQAAATEVDPAKQKQVFSEWNDIVLDESAVAPITTAPQLMIARKNVNATRMDLAWAYDFHNVWLG